MVLLFVGGVMNLLWVLPLNAEWLVISTQQAPFPRAPEVP
ncbi:exported hypothetical protein [Candidatus Propionivibrio aalborgensis]|uniref:Uncharacterized protein n=2 Tax=Candidatus Propionivibrio aalborgensis TaxID=1860101 RepID=A0A1A8Y1P4_9RHOO|nr:exported hypothetical protein [Candidatus Propionivibrio aalborgensis]